MRAQFRKVFLLLLIAATLAALAFHASWIVGRPVSSAAAAEPAPTANNDDDALRAFAVIDPVDTHVHAFKSDPAFTELMTRLQLHVLDICVADTQGIYNDLATEVARAKGFVKSSSGHAKLCVTFNPFTFQQKDFAQNT